MKTIGLTGLAGSGKDSVGKILVEEFGGMGMSFAEPVKRMTAAAMGCDREKLEERAFKDSALGQGGFWTETDEREACTALIPAMTAFAGREITDWDEPATPYTSASWWALLQKLAGTLYWMYEQADSHEAVTVRTLMQHIGTEWGRQQVCESIWVQHLHARVDGCLQLLDSEGRAHPRALVITDVRFNDEAQYVRWRGNSLWFVDRPGLEPDGHSSEAGVDKKWLTGSIDNGGSLEELEGLVRSMVRTLGDVL